MKHEDLIREYLRFYNDFNGFNGHNGIRVSEVREGYGECFTEITRSSLNPQGSAHGGLIFTLCDVAAGLAALSYGRKVLTLDSTVNFLRLGRGKKLRAVGQCLKAGKNICFCEAEVYDEGGTLVAKGSFNMFRTETTLEQFFGELRARELEAAKQ